MKVREILLVLVLLIPCLGTFGQTGIPFIQNFSPSYYQSNSYVSSPQNWDVIRDHRGILYVANTSGILEYDGVKWRMVAGTEDRAMFRFARDQKGRIFSGGKNELGYFRSDASGTIRFESLLPLLKEDVPEFRIFQIESVGEDLYFLSENHLFHFSGHVLEVLPSQAGFRQFTSSRGQVYLLEKEKGLCLLEKNNTLTSLPGGEKLVDLRTVSILPLPENQDEALRLLLITFTEGIFRFENARLQKIPLLFPTSGLSHR